MINTQDFCQFISEKRPMKSQDLGILNSYLDQFVKGSIVLFLYSI